MATASASHYIPGVCNINPVEIRKRRMVGHFGLAVTIVLVVLALAFNVSWIFRIVVIIPAFVAATGYLQAHNKFCVGFASAKQQNADNGEIVEITDKEALALDRRKTTRMNLQATIIAAAVTAIVCVIPL